MMLPLENGPMSEGGEASEVGGVLGTRNAEEEEEVSMVEREDRLEGLLRRMGDRRRRLWSIHHPHHGTACLKRPST